MAARFGVGGSFTWDASDTTHWSATSGGLGGASVPGSGDTVELNEAGATVTLTYSPTVSTMKLTAGTLDRAGYTLTASSFSSSNSNARGIVSSGAGGITVTGSGTPWAMQNAANFTLTGDLTITATANSGPLAFFHGSTGASHTETNSPSLNITASTADKALLGGWKNVNFTGSSSTLGNDGRTIYGNWTADSSVTFTSGGSATIFKATSGTQIVTSDGVTHNFSFIVNAVGAVVQLADSLTLDSASTLTHTAGKIDLNGKAASVGRFDTSGSTAREIDFSAAGSKIVTTDTTAATVFNAGTTTNLTVTRGSGTIEIGGNTTNIRTANLGAGISWPAISFTNTTANGELDLVSSGTATVIKSLAVSVPPQTIKRMASTTIGIEQDTTGFPSGTLGNLVTIGSLTAASHTWNKVGGGIIDSPYLSISRSTATPANTWYAGPTSTDGGNNSQWLWTTAPINVALTGVVGTGAAGSFGIALGINGVTATGYLGTLGVSVSKVLTGVEGVGLVGQQGPYSSVAISGVEGTGAVGTLVLSFSLGLTGVESTSALGTLAPSLSTVLGGVEGTSAAGEFGLALGLTGVSATGYTGDLTPLRSMALTGVVATGYAGLLTSVNRQVHAHTGSDGLTPHSSGSSLTPHANSDTLSPHL